MPAKKATKKPRAPKAQGVKFEVTPEVLHQVETMAGLGLSIGKIAAVLGISRDTMYATKAREEAFEQALAAGQGKAERDVAEALLSVAKSGDVPAIKWYEQTRCGRTDKQALEVSGPNGAPLQVEVSDAKQRLAERLARLGPANDSPSP